MPVRQDLSTVRQNVEPLSIADQVRELLAALALNKSQLAEALRVTRPTIYEWFQGKEPKASNTERLYALLRLLSRASVSGAMPLNARFVRQPLSLDEPSLLTLLCEDKIDEARVLRTLEKAKAAANVAMNRRNAREERLRALGFEEPSNEQRKEQLAKNIALRTWPKQ